MPNLFEHFRAKVPSARLSIIEVDVSGINEANASAVKTVGVIHDLQGRRLASPPDKGVYILDGKKYVK